MKKTIKILENKVAQLESITKTLQEKRHKMIEGYTITEEAWQVMRSDAYIRLFREEFEISDDIGELKHAIATLQRVFLCEAAVNSKSGKTEG